MIRTFLFLWIFLCVGVSSVLAIGDQFIIGLSVSGDITAPTTPGPVIATPVAATQIDVVWGASVDNDTLAGYLVFRDAVQVATTTLTSFSDTGLTPSTTYSYTVQAFDVTYNYSSTSVPVATTTLAVPVVPTSTAPTSSRVTTVNATKVLPKLNTFLITPSIHEALVTFDTNVYIRYELRWGKTTNYELGAVQSQLYERSHLTKITDLEPGTRYQYELRVYNQQGEMFVLARDAFFTNNEADTTAPTNVGNLVATVVGEDVVLTWTNPTDPDFAYLRIVRNYRFYPLDPSAGYIAYQGNNTTFTDRDAFANSRVQYYTVFTYDKKGNVSAGVVVVVYRTMGIGDQVGEGSGVGSSTSTPVLPIDQLPPPLVMQFDLRFSQLSFWQNEHALVIDNGVVVGSDAWATKVHLPYDVAPPHLKTILFEVEETALHNQTYLMRINKDGTGYETLVPNLRPGTYPVTLAVFDYQTNVISRVSGTFIIEATASTLVPSSWSITWCWWVVFLGLLLVYVWILWRRRRVEDK